MDVHILKFSDMAAQGHFLPLCLVVEVGALPVYVSTAWSTKILFGSKIILAHKSSRTQKFFDHKFFYP